MNYMIIVELELKIVVIMSGEVAAIIIVTTSLLPIWRLLCHRQHEQYMTNLHQNLYMIAEQFLEE